MDCAREFHSTKENTRSTLKETGIESCKIRRANAQTECRERERVMREKERNSEVATVPMVGFGNVFVVVDDVVVVCETWKSNPTTF